MRKIKINFKAVFKKLTVFDFLIIAVVLFSLLFLSFFLLRRSKQVEVVVKITSKNVLYSWDTPPNWFVEFFHEGMVAKDNLGRETAKIKRILRYDTSPSTKALYLTLDFKADYSLGTGKYSYEGKPLIVGAPIKVEFQDILVEGLATHIEGMPETRKEKNMTVKVQVIQNMDIYPETEGIPDYVERELKVGEEIKDSMGNVIMTVINRQVEPAKKIVTNSQGNVFVARDPIKKDVYLTLKLKVKEFKNGTDGYEYYLFDNIRIKIGERIALHFNKVSVYPVITDILEVD